MVKKATKKTEKVVEKKEKKTTKKVAVEKTFNPYGSIDDVLDVIEKQEGLTVGESNRVKISTGLLVVDMIMGGGLTSGAWHTFFGGEQSSKSTLAMTQLAKAAVDNKVPIKIFADYEGSYSPDYMLAIAKSLGFKGDTTDLFGLQDDNGKYIKTPMIRRYSVAVAEKFFNMVYKLEKSLPDKIFKKGKWWLVYDDTKENNKLREQGDSKLYAKTKRIWIEAENDAPQALVVVDSYPAMLPAGLDDEESKNGMAAQARMFSEQLKRVKGRMEQKAIIIMGINQLRLRPAVMFGCLHSDTEIIFANGESYPIEKVVNEKIQGDVWAWDATKTQFVPAKITNWFNNGEVIEATDWVTLTAGNLTQDADIFSVTVTPNHKILTHAGWLEARFITTEHTVLHHVSSSNSPLWVRVLQVDKNDTEKFEKRTKYDIEVAGLSNYLAGSKNKGFIVHNSPEYESGGESLKFFSDVRLKMVSRAVPQGEPRKKDSTNFAEEPSVEIEDGIDTYRYVNVKAVKNKLSANSDLAGWVRIWVRDGEGQARGYDPVWDTAEFLRSIGVLTGSRNKMVIDWDKLSIKNLEGKQKFDWQTLKTLIVGSKEQRLDALGKKKEIKNFNLRKHLFSLVENGKAKKMYFAQLKTKATNDSDDD